MIIRIINFLNFFLDDAKAQIAEQQGQA